MYLIKGQFDKTVNLNNQDIFVYEYFNSLSLFLLAVKCFVSGADSFIFFWLSFEIDGSRDYAENTAAFSPYLLYNKSLHLNK